MNNCCSYDRVCAIETAQAELAIELSKRQFPLPLIPKDEYSKVLLRLWFDNFDVNKENKEGSIHTCHGVAYTESSSQTLERTSEIQMPKSSRRSLGMTHINFLHCSMMQKTLNTIDLMHLSYLSCGRLSDKLAVPLNLFHIVTWVGYPQSSKLWIRREHT